MKQTDSRDLALRIVHWALSKKGENIAMLDLRGILDVTDAFVIVTGFSEIQVQTIADAIVDGTKSEGVGPNHVEGREAGRWILIDFVDVVVHVMLPEERDRYRLDALWGDAAMTEYDERENATQVREATVLSKSDGEVPSEGDDDS